MLRLRAIVVVAIAVVAGGGAAVTTSHGAAAAAPAAANAVPAVTTAYFNDPVGDATHRDTIQSELESLIAGAPAGSTIRFNLFEQRSERLTDYLSAAKQRGVHVQVAGDGTLEHPTAPGATVNPTFLQLKEKLGTTSGAPATSGVKVCYHPGDDTLTGKYSCNAASQYGMHHTKFVLFSSTGGRSDVIFETSENVATYESDPHPNSGVNGYNNAVVLINEPTLYAAYLARFEAYWSGASAPYDSTASSDAKAYFMPYPTTSANRKKVVGSPIYGVLDNIQTHHDCTAHNTTGGWGPNHLTEIDVVQAQINDANIAQKLLDLDNEGCVVRVVRNVDYNNTLIPASKYQWRNDEFSCADEILANGGSKDGITQHQIDDGRWIDPPGGGGDSAYYWPKKFDYVHSKYLIVSGSYYGQTNTQVVWTGSYNYTYGALRQNDETLLKLQIPSVVSAFRANFEKLVALPNPSGFPAGHSYNATVQGGYEVGPVPQCS